jgi:hypothetical protein
MLIIFQNLSYTLNKKGTYSGQAGHGSCI